MGLRSFFSSACRLRYLGIAIAVCCLSACISVPTQEDLERQDAPHLAERAPGGILDARSHFRPFFCNALGKSPDGEAAGDQCGNWLHRLDDEGPAEQPVFAAAPARLDVVLVPGAFGECFGKHALPFRTAITETDTNAVIRTVHVSGRSGTEHNAREIARFLAEHPAEQGLPRVLVGYSKGANDILQFLIDYPEEASQIDAVVSVAGAIYGSPLADLFNGAYRLLFSHLPMSRCESGDSGVVESLKRDVRVAWMERARLPVDIRYYSLAAFTTRDRVARALVPSWKHLLRQDQRNDGQLLTRDSLIPGSTLLGYVNADHWAVAMEIELELEYLAHRKNPDRFPHKALLDAILEYVAADLAAGGPRVHFRTGGRSPCEIGK